MFTHASLRDILSMVGAITIFVAYFVPTINAYRKQHKKAVWILVLNILTGWTVIGWGIAYIWSRWTENASQAFRSPFSKTK